MEPPTADAPRTLPGGTLVSRVAIYQSPSVDSQRGGTPHLHLACDEMYYVLSGEGAVELITSAGVARRRLAPGDAICFTPGTIHRAINGDGNLVVLVVMQNKGLPERGDAAVCFPRRVLADREAYQEAMKVDDDATAERRRDLGVEGFLELKRAFERSAADGREALDAFYHTAIDRTAHRYEDWERAVEEGPAAEVSRTRRTLERLKAGSTEPLQDGHFFGAATGSHQGYGFCGRISAYHPSEESPHTLEGVRPTR